MTRILIFLACWKRPEITEVCFAGIQRLKAYDPDRFRVEALAVISEESMIPLCDRYGIAWTMSENRPVGRKKNNGLNEAFKYEWDYLLEMGSDDLLRNEVLEVYEPYFKRGTPLMGMTRLIFMDSASGEAREYENAAVFGMGRAMSREMLQRVTFGVECEIVEGFITGQTVAIGGTRQFIRADRVPKLGRLVKPIDEPSYHLWGDILNQGLDNNSNFFMMENGVPLSHIPTSESLGMDIKGEENIWPFNPELGRAYDVNDFLKHVSVQERELLERVTSKVYV